MEIKRDMMYTESVLLIEKVFFYFETWLETFSLYLINVHTKVMKHKNFLKVTMQEFV